MTGRRRPLLVGSILLVAAIATGSWVVFRRFVYEPPRAPPPAAAAPVAAPTPAEEPPRQVSVLSVAGTVEKGRPDGTWQGIAAGEALLADDRVRTGAVGSAELSVGDRARLTLTEASQLDVRELTNAVHRFKLTRGRIKVEYQRERGRVLRIEGADGGAAVEAEDARFGVLANGAGLAVATETGVVELRSAGASVAVAAGQQALARAGEAPGAAAPIPVDVLLKVADASRVGGPVCAELRGLVEAGAEVAVDGEAVPVSPDGRFALSVPRRGRKEVTVLTRMADGRSTERKVACRSAASGGVRKLRLRWKGEPGS